MNLYITMMQARRLKINIRIRPRSKPFMRGQEDPEQARLYKKWESKMTQQISLIYNPVVAMVFEPVTSGSSAYNGELRKNLTSIMPIHMCYQFAGILSRMGRHIVEDDWFTMVDNQPQLIRDKVESISRKISLPRENTILITPTLIYDQEEAKTYRGVQIQNHAGTIGYLTHQEMLSLIDTINHLDISSYTLLAAVADQIDGIDTKTDLMNKKLDQVLDLIKNGGSYGREKDKPHVSTDGIDRWETLPGGGQTNRRGHSDPWA